MTKTELQEKKDKSRHDCDTCEFRPVPLRIEPCKSCDSEHDNWIADARKLETIARH